MDTEAAANRVTDLADAFRALSATVPGLTVDVVGHMSNDRSLVHPVAGFRVKLQHPGEAAGVSLYVSASYAEMTRWPSEGGTLRERFNVKFSEGFVWGETPFSEASELAQEVLGYMQFNLDAVSLP